MAAWIEIDDIENPAVYGRVAARVAAWIEIRITSQFRATSPVAARVAAWIEIIPRFSGLPAHVSPPVWRRGLK